MNINQALATVALLFLCATVMDVADAARYVPKWKKQACEVPASQNEQSHYTCDDNGEVKCLLGKFEPLIQFISNPLINLKTEKIFILFYFYICKHLSRMAG